MEITNGRVGTFHYTLTGADGTIIDQSTPDTPLSYLHGAGNIVPGLEKALTGKQPGDTLKAEVAPEQGYGPRHDAMVQQVPLTAFPDAAAVQPGMQFEARTANGPRLVTVTGIGSASITIDGNHPLAGQTLNFDLEVAQVRDATEAERSQGHVIPSV